VVSGKQAVQVDQGNINNDGFLEIRSNMKTLGRKINDQDGGLKLLYEKASHLELVSKKSQSPTVSSAIKEVLEVVKSLHGCRGEVASAFNVSWKCVWAITSLGPEVLNPGSMVADMSNRGTQTEERLGKGVGVVTKNAATNTVPPTSTSEAQKVPRTRQQQQPKQKPQQLKQQPRQQQKLKQQPRQQQKQQPIQQQQQKRQQQQQRQQEVQQQQQQQSQQQQTWSEVVRKRKPPKPAQQPRPAADQVAVLRKRAPRSMAVTIDRPAEGGSLAVVMKKVSGSINLQSLGVKVLTTRKTRAGGILLEVEGNENATLLAEKIREVVGDAARVRLPEPRTPVLLLGVPEWAEAEDVATGVTQAGVTGVTSESVTIRKNSGGRGEFVASLHLPLKDAITLAEKKVVTVEWTKCRVKLLVNNQPTCFRCQGKGHLAAECRNEAKPRRCHGCNKDDHLVKHCALQKQTQQQQQPQPSSSSCEAPAEGRRAV